MSEPEGIRRCCLTPEGPHDSWCILASENQSVNGNHDPSSQDVDSAWLSVSERENEFSNDATNRWHWHAELADELINELATALQDIRRRHYDKPALLSQSSIGFEALRRVDAIRKQTP